MTSKSLDSMRSRALTPAQVIHEVNRDVGLGLMGVEEADDILMHYGIKGMKWGVRRSVGPDGRVSSGGVARKTASLTFKGAKATGRGVKKTYQYGKKRSYEKRLRKGKVDVSKMSDSELKSVLDRLNMEKQYKDVTKALNPGASSTPKAAQPQQSKPKQTNKNKKAKGFIMDNATKIASTQLQTQANKRLGAYFDKQLKDKEEKKQKKEDAKWIPLEMPNKDKKG